jgi:hypothetical protein
MICEESVMSGDSKGIPAGPDRPHDPKDIYGGVWGPCEPPGEDISGRGSAPHAPEAPGQSALPGEHASFDKPKSEEGEGPEIAADDAGASARCETPQPKKPGVSRP